MTCVWDGCCGYRSSSVIAKPVRTLAVAIRIPRPPCRGELCSPCGRGPLRSGRSQIAPTRRNDENSIFSQRICTGGMRIATSPCGLLAMTCEWDGCCGYRSSSVIAKPVRTLAVAIRTLVFFYDEKGTGGCGLPRRRFAPPRNDMRVGKSQHLTILLCHCEASAHTGCGNPHPPSSVPRPHKTRAQQSGSRFESDEDAVG